MGQAQRKSVHSARSLAVSSLTTILVKTQQSKEWTRHVSATSTGTSRPASSPGPVRSGVLSTRPAGGGGSTSHGRTAGPGGPCPLPGARQQPQSTGSAVPGGNGSKAGSEGAHGATGTAWACLVHVLNYAIEKHVNVLNILELFLTCLFRRQISVSYYITLLNYLFTAQNTCIICASCYYNPKLMFIYFSTYVVEIALWLYQLAFFFFFPKETYFNPISNAMLQTNESKGPPYCMWNL